MATKRQKKEEAKRRIDEAVPTLPLPTFAPAPLRAVNLVLGGAEALAQGLVEIDPLGIITNDQVIANRPTQGPRPMPPQQMMMAMVNDPGFKLNDDQVQLINDDSRMVADTGMGLVEVTATPGAKGPGQFDRSRLLRKPRGRKKTKTDRNMSKALEEANRRMRKRNGQLRKGKTQADIMRLAHRLRRKMK